MSMWSIELSSAPIPLSVNVCPYASGVSLIFVPGLCSTITGAVLSIANVLVCVVLWFAASLISISASYDPSSIPSSPGSNTALQLPLPPSPVITWASALTASPRPSVRFSVTFTPAIVPSSLQLPLIPRLPRTIESTGGLVISTVGTSVSTALPSPISHENINIIENKQNNENK